VFCSNAEVLEAATWQLHRGEGVEEPVGRRR
jgi:hypothetical protein